MRRSLADGLKKAAGVVDQGALAAASFVSTVLMGRALDPGEFGIYALAFAIMILAERVQHGLISAPLLALPKDPDAPPLGGSGRVQAILLSVISLAVVLASELASSWVEIPGGRWTTAALLVALMCIQVRDLVRCGFYRLEAGPWAAAVGGVSAATQLAALAILMVAGRLTVTTGILAMGLGAAAGTAVGVAGDPRLAARGRQTTRTATAIWERGRWLALSNGVFWSATQLFLFAAAGLLGPAQAGIFRAAQSVLGPTQFIVSGLFNSFVPGVAGHLSAGQGVWRSVSRSVLTMGGAVAAYCAIAAVFPNAIMTALFGMGYAGHGAVVRAMALGYLMAGLAGGMTLVLVALHRTDLALRGHLFALSISLLLVYPLIVRWRLVGAALGLSTVYTFRFLALAYYAKIAARQATTGEHRAVGPMASQGSDS